MNLTLKKNSITTKTLISIVLFSSVILFILWVFQIGFLNFFYEKYTISSMNTIKRNITKMDETNLVNSLETIAYENEICIELIDGNQSIVFNPRMKGCLLGKNNSQIIKFEKNMITYNTFTKLELTDPNLDIKSLLYGLNLNGKYVFMYTTLEDINTTTVVLKGQLIYVTLIVMILAVLIAYFISKRITNPIVKITKSAKKLGEGNYDVLFEKNGINEIDELSDTLTYTARELSKTTEIKRDLMANVSHDLKTPLTMIKAYAEMVKDYSYKNKIKRNEDLDIIIKETDRLNYLVNDILDLSKLQADKEQLNIEEYDLAIQIKDIIKRYKYLNSEGYKIKYKGLKSVIVKADKSKISQVIYNLVNNAINYTGDDKTVDIDISKQKNKILVEIKDTGKGIKPEDLKYIWDKYYKTDKNYRRNIVGTGIGLSIVKEILLYHNFKYGVKSVLGEGTTFYFYINL